MEASAVINPSKNGAEIQDRFLMRFLPTLVRFWCHFGKQKTTQSAPKPVELCDFGKTFLDALKKPPICEKGRSILGGLVGGWWAVGGFRGGKNSRTAKTDNRKKLTSESDTPCPASRGGGSLRAFRQAQTPAEIFMFGDSSQKRFLEAKRV